MAIVTGGKHFGQYTFEHWFDNEYANNILIDELETEEINYVSNMISNIFDEFVGKDYSEEGNKVFKDYISPQNILIRLNEKSSRFLTAKHGDEIIGILEIKNKDHISLFFVKKEFLGKGIGKKLLKYYLRGIKNDNSGIKIITVNSSVYAEKIYSKLGFTKTSEIQEKDGIKYIPMEYIL
jgi:GNAT superfamily N-acetyltransferase